MRSIIAGTLVIFLLGFIIARAQTLDLPHPHSETVLSGIDVSRTNGQGAIEILVRALGQPTRQEIDAQDKRVHHYYWEGDGPWLRVTEMSATDKPTDLLPPRITSVDVWGAHPSGNVGVTGAGLALGATLNDARRIYPFGFKYEATGLDPSARMSGDYTTGCLTGSGLAPTLEIRFKKGVVVYMKLTNPWPTNGPLKPKTPCTSTPTPT
jgi:hypothetical protein